MNWVPFVENGSCTPSRWTLGARPLLPRPQAERAGGTRAQCQFHAGHGRLERPPEAPPSRSTDDHTAAAATAPYGQGSGEGGGSADGFKKDSGLLGRGKGRLTSTDDRRKALEIHNGAICAGARAHAVSAMLGVGLTILQRWRRQFASGRDSTDHRKGSPRSVSNQIREEERQRILLSCNQQK